jgi:exonuclease VII small subunit
VTDRAPDPLEQLEKVIGRLVDEEAPLEDLVAAHQQALRLLDQADAELARLKSRAAELTEALKA